MKTVSERTCRRLVMSWKQSHLVPKHGPKDGSRTQENACVKMYGTWVGRPKGGFARERQYATETGHFDLPAVGAYVADNWSTTAKQGYGPSCGGSNSLRIRPQVHDRLSSRTFVYELLWRYFLLWQIRQLWKLRHYIRISLDHDSLQLEFFSPERDDAHHVFESELHYC